MIRGAIEVAQKGRVAGWIFSGADTVRDKMILAFVGPRCVGSGKVDRFRKDLLEAKLGDGYCGFDFPIRLNDDELLGAVVVRLQASDASLIQTASRVVGLGDASADAGPDFGLVPPDSLSWMQDQGWLDQPEYDFLKAVHTIGAYERGLRAAKRPGEMLSDRAEPELVAQSLLSLMMMRDVEITRSTVASLSDLAGPLSALRKSPLGVVALWSEGRGRISLDERSHAGPVDRRGVILDAPPLGGIDYSFGPDRLLFLHRDCVFSPQGPAPVQGIVVLTATSVVAAQSPGKPVAMPAQPAQASHSVRREKVA